VTTDAQKLPKLSRHRSRRALYIYFKMSSCVSVFFGGEGGVALYCRIVWCTVVQCSVVYCVGSLLSSALLI
jgi:hypothetical protein